MKANIVRLASLFLHLMLSRSSDPFFPANPVTPLFANLSITTDKATYNPGDEVTFTIDDNLTLPSTTKVRYKFKSLVIEDILVTSATWNWRTPTTDFCGYIAEVYATSNKIEIIYATIGIDVSSEWKRFPRYGFLSKFNQMSDDAINAVIKNLNRFHINGLQFYDWQNKHHKPLPLYNWTPLFSWKDIGNRDILFSTVSKYISAAHSFNMKAMFYDLIYGAWDNAEADGVNKEWYIFKDNAHTHRDFLLLPSFFLSNLYLLDPSNTGWQDFMLNEVEKVYRLLDFDGYHIDQLGDRGICYTYNGSPMNLGDTFKSYIDSMKREFFDKYNVMNAVTQYGQQSIASSTADFLYSEVWSPFDSYYDLANIIIQNNVLSRNSKNSVLAAYMNYDLANNKGFFNTPSVLMTNAVIFAFGGAHLELGEHMLCKEYFPNDNLDMNDDLKSALVNYYDFLVAYQNLLRDGGEFNTVKLSTKDNKMIIDYWPSNAGKVAVFGKKMKSTQVIHLINFTNSKTEKWRDEAGIQVSPVIIKDAKVELNSPNLVKKLWVASPDIIGGASRSLNFVQFGTIVSFILPELLYWDMIVVEY